MGDNHNHSFFGQTSAIIFNSSKTELFIYLKFLKKKADGAWEKPSLGEGRSIKMSTEECISMLEVLNKKALSWSTYHSFKEIKTSISFKWEDKSAKLVWINIDSRSKMLNKSQAEFFRRLLEHVVQEQIENGTLQKPKS